MMPAPCRLNHSERSGPCWPSLLILLFILLGASCGSKSPQHDLLIGSWRNQDAKTHTIITFMANGNWQMQIRIEGSFSKIVEKKGNISGTWAVDQSTLRLIVLEKPFELTWVNSEVLGLAMLELTKEHLKFKRPDGHITQMQRVRGTASAAAQVNAAIKPEPFVVNLAKPSVEATNRFLCMKIELEVDRAEHQQPLPARAREAVLLHLSTLTDNEVNTNAKLNAIVEKLGDLINPYVGGQIKRVVARNLLVTAHNDAVDTFMQQHLASDSKNTQQP